MDMANDDTGQEILRLYGDDEQSWRVQYAKSLFLSNESMRWFFGNDGHQDDLMEQGLIFYSGRRLMTAAPRRLLAAVVEQMKSQSRGRTRAAA